MKIAYYPGCSLHKMAKEYNKSTYKVSKALDLELEELEGWNCCGAMEVSAIDPLAADGIVARNLALAETQGYNDLMAVCPACSHKLISVNRKMELNDAKAEEINSLLDRSYTPGAVNPIHFLQVLKDKIGLDKIRQKVLPGNPLEGKKGVSYYGCLCTRPGDVIQFEDPNNPTFMDDILRVIGVEVPHFPMKTKCCGATQLMVNKPLVESLTGNILLNAHDVGAEFVVVACQMCAQALDGQQKQSLKRVEAKNVKLPVLYISQALGIAMGMSYGMLGLGSNFVSPKRLLARKSNGGTGTK
ncbi:MAG: CoB--CoM heterodisulfide reductase iron-sulfur subunit B family protein [Candidatus Thorarchaeota archaeon]